jgi:hypothetical protein
VLSYNAAPLCYKQTEELCRRNTAKIINEKGAKLVDSTRPKISKRLLICSNPMKLFRQKYGLLSLECI